jgi:hypothetical protein
VCLGRMRFKGGVRGAVCGLGALPTIKFIPSVENYF